MCKNLEKSNYNTGIPTNAKKTTLQGAFDEFGRIVKIELPQDKPGIAFVEFEEAYV